MSQYLKQQFYGFGELSYVNLLGSFYRAELEINIEMENQEQRKKKSLLLLHLSSARLTTEKKDFKVNSYIISFQINHHCNHIN